MNHQPCKCHSLLSTALYRPLPTSHPGPTCTQVSLSLAEDAVRRYLLHGRMWMAVLRGCGAAWLAACGTVVLEPGG